MPTKSIFFSLAQLSTLIDLVIDPKCIESKNFNDNYGKNNGNMSNRVSDEKLVTKKKLEIRKKPRIEEELGIKDLEI